MTRRSSEQHFTEMSVGRVDFPWCFSAFSSGIRIETMGQTPRGS